MDTDIILTPCSTCADLWYAGLKHDRSGHYDRIAEYGELIEVDVLRFLGNLPFRDVTVEQFDRVLGSLMEEYADAVYVNRVRQAAELLFHFAQDHWLLKSNPASGARRYSQGIRIRTPFDRKEFCAIMSSFSSVGLGNMLKTQFCSGLFGRELRYLRVPQFSQDTGRLIVGGMSTRKREILLPEPAAESIRAELELRSERIREGLTTPGCEYIFLNEKGNQISDSEMASDVRKVRLQSGVFRYSLRAARYHMAYAMLLRGCTVKDLQLYYGFFHEDTALRYEEALTPKYNLKDAIMGREYAGESREGGSSE